MTSRHYVIALLCLGAALFLSPAQAANVNKKSPDEEPQKQERVLTAPSVEPQAGEEAPEDDKPVETEEEENEPAAQSEPEPEKELRPAVLKTDLSRIEAAGIYTSIKDGALGKDLWSNSRRSVIEKLMPQLPDLNSTGVVRYLTLGFLTTAASPSLLINDVNDTAQDGYDLTTLRIEKLISIGAYDKAMELYNLINKEPYHPKLARAGIMAMLFKGERSLACLEYKTIEDRNFQGDFWNDLSLYCDYVLLEKDEARTALKNAKNPVLKNIASRSNYKVVYNTSKLGNRSAFSRALLVAEDRIIFNTLTKGDIESLPPEDVLFVLQHEDLSDQLKLFASIQAASYNLVSIEKLTELYQSIARDSKKAPAAWNALPRLWHEAKNERNDRKRWAILRQVYTYKNTMGLPALLPFAELIEDINPGLSDLNDIQTTFEILNLARLRVDSDWKKILNDMKPSKSQENKWSGLYLIALLHDPNSNLSAAEVQFLKDVVQGETTEITKKCNIIIETLDKFNKHIHNPAKVYEKNLKFADTTAYKMPAMKVWDILEKTAEEQRIGETIALSTLVLHGVDYQDMYPGLFREVVNSFNAVGFTNVSRDLLTEYILDHLN